MMDKGSVRETAFAKSSLTKKQITALDQAVICKTRRRRASDNQKLYFGRKITKWRRAGRRITERLISKCWSGMTTASAWAHVRKRVAREAIRRGEDPGAPPPLHHPPFH
jgi:hypothetical protein